MSDTMVARKFEGGPWDGETHKVPENAWYWRVLVRPEILICDTGPMENKKCDYRVVDYGLHRFRFRDSHQETLIFVAS